MKWCEIFESGIPEMWRPPKKFIFWDHQRFWIHSNRLKLETPVQKQTKIASTQRLQRTWSVCGFAHMAQPWTTIVVETTQPESFLVPFPIPPEFHCSPWSHHTTTCPFHSWSINWISKGHWWKHSAIRNLRWLTEILGRTYINVVYMVLINPCTRHWFHF